MTELDKIIRSRKSVYPKDFSGDPISQEELEALLSATVYAPNHKKTQPWRFQVLRGNSKKLLGQKLADLYYEHTPTERFLPNKQVAITEKINSSDSIIAIIHHISQSVPDWEEVAAIAMSVQNLWLKTQELGLGGYWSSPGSIDFLDEFLQLEKNEKCIGLFYLGKYNGEYDVRDYDWRKFVQFKD